MVLNIDEINMLSGVRIALREKVCANSVMDFNSRSVGGNLEFEDYKQYTPGENTRHIDWNRYMRDSNLVVKRYQQQQRPEFSIIVDLSPSIVAADKVDQIKKFASAICFCLLNRGITIKLYSNGSFVRYQGKQGWQRFKNDIEALSLENSKMFPGQRSGSHICKNVIVVSDLIFSGGIDEFKQKMIFGYRRCTLYGISNDFDRSPKLSGNLRLLDSQNSKKLNCLVNDKMIEKYFKARNAYFENIENHCLKMNWIYRDINAEDSLKDQFLSIAPNGTLLF